MLTLYAATAGVFLLLAAACVGSYLWRDRDRRLLAAATGSLVLAITAIATAVKPSLLPFLTPVSLLAFWASWKLKDKQAPKS